MNTGKKWKKVPKDYPTGKHFGKVILMVKIGRKKWLKAICLLAAASLMMTGCTSEQEEGGIVVIEHETEDIAYDFGVAELSDVYKTEKFRCTYRQMDEQEVSFSIGGKLVDQVYVKEGESVTKGTLLAELSSEDLERSIEDLQYRISKNELSLQFLETNENNEISSMWVNYLYFSGKSKYDKESLDTRIENLQKNNKYTREDLSDALENDRKALAQKRKDLSNSRVYAEIDGVVYKLKSNLRGTTSKADEVIMTIMDTSGCLFETQVANADKIFREKESVSMNISYGTGAGQYELIPYDMQNWGETQLFEILEGPEGASIDVGTSGTMQVITDRRENVLTVPLNAVHTADGKAFVYVLGADNMREVKWVETGLYGDSNVEILSGLAEGEKVIRR